MKYKKNDSKDRKESNIPSKKSNSNSFNKINNGFFVFTKALTVGELAKELNINASDIIKKLF